jgi:Transposase DDE domain
MIPSRPAVQVSAITLLDLLVDSTGLKLCGAGEWLVEKHGTRTRRSWWKPHIGTDAETGQTVAAGLITGA